MAPIAMASAMGLVSCFIVLLVGEIISVVACRQVRWA